MCWGDLLNLRAYGNRPEPGDLIQAKAVNRAHLVLYLPNSTCLQVPPFCKHRPQRLKTEQHPFERKLRAKDLVS